MSFDWDTIERYADEHQADFSRLTISYQVTMNIGESEDEARTANALAHEVSFVTSKQVARI